jgi:hypothetical protein
LEDFVDNGDETFRVYTFGSSSAGGEPAVHYLDILALIRETRGGLALDFGDNQFEDEAVRIE